MRRPHNTPALGCPHNPSLWCGLRFAATHRKLNPSPRQSAFSTLAKNNALKSRRFWVLAPPIGAPDDLRRCSPVLFPTLMFLSEWVPPLFFVIFFVLSLQSIPSNPLPSRNGHWPLAIDHWPRPLRHRDGTAPPPPRRYLHHSFVCAVLNDVFGIQVCSPHSLPSSPATLQFHWFQMPLSLRRIICVATFRVLARHANRRDASPGCSTEHRSATNGRHPEFSVITRHGTGGGFRQSTQRANVGGGPLRFVPLAGTRILLISRT